ncbi:hypothetical protein HA402_006282 [Bradysia odoriphaga]|nr:hypothetical protein HA402_006282 [Bradysia odoriphaga]
MNLLGNLSRLITFNARPIALNQVHKSHIHLSSTLFAYEKKQGSYKWLEHNKTIFPPQTPDETPRPAYVCHVNKYFKYSPEKMWYIAILVRGMSVDEAVRQLSFVEKKGSDFAKQTILEAQKMAVERHNVEYKTNLWVAESFVGKGRFIKGARRHARRRIGEVEYKYCHYYVRLEEGKPPVDYYRKNVTPSEQLEKYMQQMRSRKIPNTL